MSKTKEELIASVKAMAGKIENKGKTPEGKLSSEEFNDIQALLIELAENCSTRAELIHAIESLPFYTKAQILQMLEQKANATAVTEALSKKQGVIADLDAIRQGAQKGMNALQPSDIPGWAKSPNKPTYTAEEVGALPANTPIPAADNEDLQNVNGALKLADKSYNASAHSGLGRKYFRKNIVDNKNVLTQAMVNTANTIYHIQYDYDLNGQTITLPAGCVLEFDGGSVKNGYIDFNSCKIIANELCFGEGLLPSFNSKLPQDIKPEWFGAIGDGVVDDTVAWERCIAFAKEIDNTHRGVDGDEYQPKFRNYYRTFSRISADRHNKYKITRQLWIDFQIDIVGGFIFNYYGAFPSENEGIINLTGVFSQCTFEFNVAHSGLHTGFTSFYPDWSNVAPYAGVAIGSADHPTTMEECHLTIGVYKCWIGIRLYGHDGSHYISCNTFEQCRFFVCMYGIVNYIHEENTATWNNDLKFFNCEFRVTGSGYTLPNNFERSAFIKVEGDGNSQMNTTVIRGLSLEGSPAKGEQSLLWIDKSAYLTTKTSGLRISDIRTEAIGTFIVSNCPFFNCIVDNSKFQPGYFTAKICDIDFTSWKIDIPGFTIIHKEFANDAPEIDLNKLYVTFGGSQYKYCTSTSVALVNSYASSVSARKTNSSSIYPAYFFKLNSGQVYEFKSKNLKAQITFKVFDSNLNVLSTYKEDTVVFGSLRYYSGSDQTDFGYAINGLSNNDAIYYIGNKSANTIYVAVYSTSKNNPAQFIVKSNSSIETYEFDDTYPLEGATENRPVLDLNDVGFKYLDKDLGFELIWNGIDWIAPNGYTSIVVNGDSLARPILSFSDNGFRYYDKALKRTIVAEISKESEIEQTVVQNVGQHISNTLTKGKTYWFEWNRKHSWGGKISFRKEIDSATDEIVVNTNFNTDVQGKYFTVPDPSVYPYIYLFNALSLAATYTISRPKTNWVYDNGYSGNRGSTASRPNLTLEDAGFEYFDEDLIKPVYWSGVIWVDASGTPAEDITITDEFFSRTTAKGNAIPSDISVIDKIYGNSLVWNQKLNKTLNTTTITGIDCTKNADGSYTFEGTNSGSSSAIFYIGAAQITEGHKYYLKTDCNNIWGSYASYFASGGMGDNAIPSSEKIVTGGSTTNASLLFVVWAGKTIPQTTVRPIIVDLTLMFGVGNEPTDVEGFRKLFPLDDYPLATSLLNVAITDFTSIAKRNLWANTISIPVVTIKSGGTTIFPNGMCSVGDVRDELTSTSAIVRIGMREHTSNDDSDTNVVTDGTNTLYVLSTPIEYILDTELDLEYTAGQGGTEKFLPENASGTPTTSMPIVQITYKQG